MTEPTLLTIILLTKKIIIIQHDWQHKNDRLKRKLVVIDERSHGVHTSAGSPWRCHCITDCCVTIIVSWPPYERVSRGAAIFTDTAASAGWLNRCRDNHWTIDYTLINISGCVRYWWCCQIFWFSSWQYLIHRYLLYQLIAIGPTVIIIAMKMMNTTHPMSMTVSPLPVTSIPRSSSGSSTTTAGPMMSYNSHMTVTCNLLLILEASFSLGYPLIACNMDIDL